MRAWPTSVKAALIAAFTLVIYLPALRNGFIWDDDAWLFKNPTIHGLTGLRDVWLNLTALQQYYPVTGTAFWIQVQLWGFNPFGYHLVNVLLHATTAVLFGLVLQKLGVRGNWFAALIFAAHPVMVESVAWITEIKNTLSTAFYLGSILAWLGFENLQRPAPPRNWKWFGLSLLLFVCALLTKSVTCSLPVALGIILWWKRGRLRVADIWPLAAYFFVALPMGLLTAWLEQHHVGATGPGWDLTFVQSCMVAGRALFFYASKLAWPAPLTFIYPRWELETPWLLLFPVAALAGMLALWLLRNRIGRAPFAAATFFIITLGPVLGFMNVYAHQFSFVADHWQYLASLGLISLASAIPGLLSFLGDKARAILLALVVLGLAALTWQQCFAYKNIETIWRHTLAKNWNCWLAQNNLGVHLRDRGRLDEAAFHFQEAIRVRPRYAEAENNLGEVFLAQGRLPEAASRIDNSLEISPRYSPALWDKALLLARMGKREEAAAIVRRGLQQKPLYLSGLNNFAWLLATSADENIRDPSRAAELASQCCERTTYLKPQYLDTLAAAYASQGRFDQAMQRANQALQLASKAGQKASAAQFAARLALYREGRPYIEP